MCVRGGGGGGNREEEGGEDKREKGVNVPSQQSVVRMCLSGTC